MFTHKLESACAL